MIITIANQKGGVGKTTIATHFACIAADRGFKTLLIDADLQRSAMLFRQARPEDRPQFQAVSITGPTIHRDVGGFDAERIFIDVGGRYDRMFRSAFARSDDALIPVCPSAYDIWSLEDVLTILDELQLGRDIKVGIVFNQVQPHTIVGREAMETMAEISKEFHIHVLKTRLYNRVAFKESAERGLAVFETAGEKFRKAGAEMVNLFEEVMTWLSSA
jgi:chromosome partitioning protein